MEDRGPANTRPSTAAAARGRVLSDTGEEELPRTNRVSKRSLRDKRSGQQLFPEGHSQNTSALGLWCCSGQTQAGLPKTRRHLRSLFQPGLLPPIPTPQLSLNAS